MQFHNELNTNTINSQVVGILLLIPITGSTRQALEATFHKCSHCAYQPRDLITPTFCSQCGNKIIEVTESFKDYRGIMSQTTPLPDVREELKQFDINYAPISKDFEDEEDGNWIFIVKTYTESGGDQPQWPRYEEFDLQQIQKDITEAQEKFADIITKYNGRIIYGACGDFSDW